MTNPTVIHLIECLLASLYIILCDTPTQPVMACPNKPEHPSNVCLFLHLVGVSTLEYSAVIVIHL